MSRPFVFHLVHSLWHNLPPNTPMEGTPRVDLRTQSKEIEKCSNSRFCHYLDEYVEAFWWLDLLNETKKFERRAPNKQQQRHP